MAEPATPPKKRCFVVGPIGKPESEVRIHADWFFEGIVQPLFKSREDLKDFAVLRADKIAAPGMIDAQIIGHLLEDELVIADLSRINPNAFYEIGIRHMIEKPIIHMHEEGGEIPFDVSLYRSIPFSRQTPTSLERAKNDLGDAISAIIAPSYVCDNPVIRARGRIEIAHSASPENKVLLDQILSLHNRISVLEGARPRSAGAYTNSIEIDLEANANEEAVRAAINDILMDMENDIMIDMEISKWVVRSFGNDIMVHVFTNNGKLSNRDYEFLCTKFAEISGVKSAGEPCV